MSADATSGFRTYWVGPKLPTTLGDREWLPLPPSDHPFYPMVNSWIVPKPLDGERLRKSLAQVLSLYPLNASQLAKNPVNGLWQLQLVNRTIPLVIGKSDRAGPCHPDWNGEKDPDYYEELPRHGNSLVNYSLAPLTRLRVTTYEATGETHLMLTQSYNLGDGFAVTGFMNAWSQFYQGRRPDVVPTFEKYFVPTPRLPSSSSHSAYLDKISWVTVDFDDTVHEEFSEKMLESTTRLYMTFDASFLQTLLQQTRRDSKISKLSLGDAFAAYLITTLRSVMDSAPRTIQQCVGYRGQTLTVDGVNYPIPLTSLGNNYIVYNLEVKDIQNSSSVSDVAFALNQSRRELADSQYLSRLFAYYSYFYERASSRGRAPFDAGHNDAIAVNNCIKLGMTKPNWGFPDQVRQIEWEVLENFIQIMDADAVRGPDGTFYTNKGDLSIVTRLSNDIKPKFEAKIKADKKLFYERMAAGRSEVLDGFFTMSAKL